MFPSACEKEFPWSSDSHLGWNTVPLTPQKVEMCRNILGCQITGRGTTSFGAGDQKFSMSFNVLMIIHKG